MGTKPSPASVLLSCVHGPPDERADESRHLLGWQIATVLHPVVDYSGATHIEVLKEILSFFHCTWQFKLRSKPKIALDDLTLHRLVGVEVLVSVDQQTE